MGNFFVESSLNPKNLQGSYERKLNMTDSQYTDAVDNGTYDNFIHDSAGYGLAQWTYHSRKANLLKFAKDSGKSIGDLDMQLNFVWKELQSYKTCLNVLLNAKSVKEASDIVVTSYEKPANQSETGKQNRANYGQKYYDMFVKKEGSEEAVVDEPLYRAIVKSDNGKSVRMRSNPSTSAIVLAEVPVGTNIEVMDVLDGWSEVVYNEETGYMMTKFLEPENTSYEKSDQDDVSFEQLKKTKEHLLKAVSMINAAINLKE